MKTWWWEASSRTDTPGWLWYIGRGFLHVEDGLNEEDVKDRVGELLIAEYSVDDLNMVKIEVEFDEYCESDA